MKQNKFVSLELLPHKSLALFLDSAEILNDNELVAYQIIPINHPILRGHFSKFKIWPGVLLIEAMAQTAALLYICHRGSPLKEDELPVLGAVDSRLFAPVYPYDQLCFHAKLLRTIEQNALFLTTATRDTKRVAAARITASVKNSYQLDTLGA